MKIKFTNFGTWDFKSVHITLACNIKTHILQMLLPGIRQKKNIFKYWVQLSKASLIQ